MYPQYILHLSSKNLSIVHLFSLHPHSILSTPPSIPNTFYIYSQTFSIYPLATRLSFVYPHYTLHLFLITCLYSIYSHNILHLSLIHPPSVLSTSPSVLNASSIYPSTTRPSFVYPHCTLHLFPNNPPILYLFSIHSWSILHTSSIYTQYTTLNTSSVYPRYIFHLSSSDPCYLRIITAPMNKLTTMRMVTYKR